MGTMFGGTGRRSLFKLKLSACLHSSTLQCIGEHAKAGDMRVNICRTKQLTNMRA